MAKNYSDKDNEFLKAQELAEQEEKELRAKWNKEKEISNKIKSKKEELENS